MSANHLIVWTKDVLESSYSVERMTSIFSIYLMLKWCLHINFCVEKMSWYHLIECFKDIEIIFLCGKSVVIVSQYNKLSSSHLKSQLNVFRPSHSAIISLQIDTLWDDVKTPYNVGRFQVIFGTLKDCFKASSASYQIFKNFLFTSEDSLKAWFWDVIFFQILSLCFVQSFRAIKY